MPPLHEIVSHRLDNHEKRLEVLESAHEKQLVEFARVQQVVAWQVRFGWLVLGSFVAYGVSQLFQL